MDKLQAIKARHSVRQYTAQKIEGDVLDALQQEIQECNNLSKLNIQLVLNEPQAFSGGLAKYGKFKNTNNYIALIGKKSDDFHKKCGYYGEKIVIKAQMLGLNTCWVALTYKKSKSPAVIAKGETLLMVIAIGYGEKQGGAHSQKPIKRFYKTDADKTIPDWFINGINLAILAPTAMNQQKFKFLLMGDRKVRGIAGSGIYTKVDLGIAKYHFEIGAGKDNFDWI